MAQFAYDVACIGNAIVDILTHADDAQIERLKLNRGIMTLVDEARAEEIYANMGPGRRGLGRQRRQHLRRRGRAGRQGGLHRQGP